MPVICKVLLPVDMKQVLRRQGIGEQVKARPQIMALLRGLQGRQATAMEFRHKL